MDNSKPEQATTAQIKYLKTIYKGENLKKLLATNKLEKIEDMSKSLASDLINKLKGE
jgi:hypothetical protein